MRVYTFIMLLKITEKSARYFRFNTHGCEYPEWNTTGYDGSRYFLSMIDDYSRLTNLYTIKLKAEVHECIKSYVNESKNLTGKRAKRICCNNGKEYIKKT